jgi:hypothetical protein
MGELDRTICLTIGAIHGELLDFHEDGAKFPLSNRFFLKKSLALEQKKE